MSVLAGEVIPEAVIPEAVLSEVGERFARTAADVDGGRADVRDGLRWLGEQGLLARADGNLPLAVALVERIAGRCMSSAFSLWAHLMVQEYLRCADVPDGEPVAPREALRESLHTGSAIGATAMAPALRDVAGLEEVPVSATPGGAGQRLNGPVRWASNLFADAVMVLPVRTSSDGGRAVLVLRPSDTGVHAAPRPELLALNGTASGSLQLRDVEVPEAAVLSRDLPGFVGRIRPAFLLIQSAFCAGLALRSVTEAAGHTGGANSELAWDVGVIRDRVDEVRGRLHGSAAGPSSVGPAGLLRLRLDAAGVAADATRVEATVRGGAGYVAGSDVSRRLREGAFLPIQAPTEGQLRWELSRYS